MKNTARDSETEIRPGTIDDIPLLLSFIHSMAEFENLEVLTTENSLRESLFGKNRAAETLLAFVNGMPAAYAVYFFTFASMVGKRGLWLDDLWMVLDWNKNAIDF